MQKLIQIGIFLLGMKLSNLILFLCISILRSIKIKHLQRTGRKKIDNICHPRTFVTGIVMAEMLKSGEKKKGNDREITNYISF